MTIKESEVYSDAVLTKKIHLPLNLVGQNIEANLKQLLVQTYEGICNVDGYIKHNSIQVLTYSSGLLESNNVVFNVVFECKICLPVEESIVKAVIKNITKAGIRAEIINNDEPTPMVIFITRDYQYTSTDAAVGDTIFAKIIGQIRTK